MIFKWWAKRKERASKSRFNSGYDYAVGALLRGDYTEEQLEIQADCQFDRGDYERGMNAGLRALHNLKTKEAQ